MFLNVMEIFICRAMPLKTMELNLRKVPTGAVFLDAFLEGGYDTDIVTTIYGPSGTGKTNLCILAAVTVALNGKKVIFIDTEGGIAVERIKQITPRYDEV